MHSLTQPKKVAPLFLIILVGLAVLPLQAVVPPPDGGYPNFTTAEGSQALQNLTTGAANTGIGWHALFSAGAGSNNTGVGAGALALNTVDNNTAVGLAAMFLNTSGHDNVAVGTGALVFNDTASSNTALGAFALYSNTSGEANTAVGSDALRNSVDGALNTAVGQAALFANTAGDQNTALGLQALSANTEGDFNTATGVFALSHNTTGVENTANGESALFDNVDGNDNTAIGRQALHNNVSGNDNTAVGWHAGLNATGSGNVYIGASVSGVAGEDNHTYIRNIKDTIVSGGGTDFVSVNLTSGLLGHASSSRRYKEEIKPMDKASEALYRLKPVTYHFKKEIDPKQTTEYGLVAEEVAQVAPNLAIRDGEGQIESVRYTAVNAMLLNEFLKEHRKNDEQAATIARLEQQIEALTTGLQKVSAQLELNRTGPQVIASDQ